MVNWQQMAYRKRWRQAVGQMLPHFRKLETTAQSLLRNRIPPFEALSLQMLVLLQHLRKQVGSPQTQEQTETQILQ